MPGSKHPTSFDKGRVSFIIDLMERKSKDDHSLVGKGRAPEGWNCSQGMQGDEFIGRLAIELWRLFSKAQQKKWEPCDVEQCLKEVADLALGRVGHGDGEFECDTTFIREEADEQ